MRRSVQTRRVLRGASAAALLCAFLSPALAQTSSESVEIGEGSFVGAQGNIGVNAVAGALNQQVNSGVVANSDDTAIALGPARTRGAPRSQMMPSPVAPGLSV
jgi:hypothetical protein